MSPNNWQEIAAPSGGHLPELTGVSASSAGNLWAVRLGPGSAFRWNGSQTVKIAFPPSSHYHEFWGVVAISPTDVWAVGDREGSVTGVTDTLLDHYTGGGSFADLGGPNADPQNNGLLGITEVPRDPSDLWAVGIAGDSPLILHHS